MIDLGTTPETVKATGPVAAARNWRPEKRHIPVLATAALFGLMYLIGVISYPGFSDTQILLNILIDNAFLLVVAIGMTFVILTGGIDLSVGAVVALSTVLCATFVQQKGWSPVIVLPGVLLVGAALGFGMGCIIHYFELQPFIVTLAGMFLARGTCYAISIDSVTINDRGFVRVAQGTIRFGDMFITTGVVVALVAVLVGGFVLHYTRLGRNVYAIGGSEQSALLMGVRVGRTKIAVYTISGFCSALGGILLSF